MSTNDIFLQLSNTIYKLSNSLLSQSEVQSKSIINIVVDSIKTILFIIFGASATAFLPLLIRKLQKNEYYNIECQFGIISKDEILKYYNDENLYDEEGQFLYQVPVGTKSIIIKMRNSSKSTVFIDRIEVNIHKDKFIDISKQAYCTFSFIRDNSILSMRQMEIEINLSTDFNFMSIFDNRIKYFKFTITLQSGEIIFSKKIRINNLKAWISHTVAN